MKIYSLQLADTFKTPSFDVKLLLDTTEERFTPAILNYLNLTLQSNPPKLVMFIQDGLLPSIFPYDLLYIKVKIDLIDPWINRNSGMPPAKRDSLPSPSQPMK